MDAVRFIEERARMCKIYEQCDGCPLYRLDMECTEMATKVPRETVEIVEKWSKEHPQKRLKDDFLERCPGAELDCANEPKVCAKNVYGATVVDCDLYSSCSDCWNRPLSEVCDE